MGNSWFQSQATDACWGQLEQEELPRGLWVWGRAESSRAAPWGFRSPGSAWEALPGVAEGSLAELTQQDSCKRKAKGLGGNLHAGQRALVLPGPPHPGWMWRLGKAY